jgi:CRISPR type III-B/RAMP module-associated protein Cmr3
MTPLLLEPTDVLFFRDGVPMSAGQGRGAGCRLPFPSTVHEAFRHALLATNGREVREKTIKGRDNKHIATKDYQSLRIQGPLPWHESHGHLFPIPLDASKSPDHRLVRHWLLPVASNHTNHTPGTFSPPCIPAANVPPDKHAVFSGWWTALQLRAYLADQTPETLTAIPTTDLWLEEARVGVEIEPERLAAKNGQLFAGSYLRPLPETRFALRVGLARPVRKEQAEFDALLAERILLLGGERRLVRLQQTKTAVWPEIPAPGIPDDCDGPCIVRWILITPALFSHGSVPGWCRPTGNSGRLIDGQVCLRESNTHADLRAHLIAHHLGRPMPVTGWDGVGGHPKATRLAVSAGSVYHFLCADGESASRLIALLHDRNRSDFYGEKGFGLGYCAVPYSISEDIRPLAGRLFNPHHAP